MSNPYVCAMCQAVFNSFEELDAHYVIVHGDVPYIPPVAVNPYVCSLCGAEYPTQQNLDVHVYSMHGIVPDAMVKCPVCGVAFSNNFILESHIALAHGTQQVFDFKCAVCSETFATQQELDAHLLSHQGQADFVCSVCGKHFVSYYEVDAHMRGAHPELYAVKPVVPVAGAAGKACMIAFLLVPLGCKFVLPYIRKIRDGYVPRILQRVYYGFSRMMLSRV